MNYYVSDFHLFHKNVTKDGKGFDNRLFENLEPGDYRLAFTISEENEDFCGFSVFNFEVVD